MFNWKQLKNGVLPVIKRFYLVLICFGSAMFGIKEVIRYSTPMYESTAKIKLDDQRFGSSNHTLYKDFDMLVATQKIESEVEMLKSDVILNKAMQNLGGTVTYARVGKIKKTELYNSSPIELKYRWVDTSLASLTLQLQIENDTLLTGMVQAKGKEYSFAGRLGDSIRTVPLVFAVVPTHKLSSGVPLAINARFECRIVSPEEIASQFDLSKLDVKSIDKDVPIIRLSYKSPVPEKSAAVVNAIAETYINDYVQFKTQSAAKTVLFIDDQLEEIGAKLKSSESNLEQFKLDHRIVNTYQETETGLRKLSQQKIQLANLDMDTKALEDMDAVVQEGGDLEAAVPQFGYGDLLFTELIKKLKIVQDERRVLLLKYTPENDKVKNADAQIAEIKNYILKAIASSRRDIENKKTTIQQEVTEASHQFDHLPTLEKKQAILERTFHLNELVYNFLSQKRTDAAIEKNANISFHRIIQYAEPEKTPVSPNKTLLTFVAGFFGLLIGVALCYIVEKGKGIVYDRQALEKQSTIPVLGILKKSVHKAEVDASVATLVKALQLQEKLAQGTVVSITSSLSGEGKNSTAHGLAQTLYSMGYKVLLVAGDLTKPPGSEKGLRNTSLHLGHAESFIQQRGYAFLPAGQQNDIFTTQFSVPRWQALLQAWKAQYDVVVVEAPPTALSIDALTIIKESDAVLYLFKANATHNKYIGYAELLKEEYGLSNLFWVVTNVIGSYSYQGHFNENRFANRRWWQRLLDRMNFLQPFKSKHA